MDSAPAAVRIATADDHQMFRDGLKRLLESEPGFEVVGEASDGLEAVQLVRDLQPDVLLLDVAMPRMGGLEALAVVPPGTRIVLLTAAIDSPDVLRAMQLGAHGVVLKESAARLLIDGIHQVMNGKYLIGADALEDGADAVQRAHGTAAPKYSLTAREREVVALIVEGETNRGIADRLGISLQTVKHHLTSVFDKTGTSSRLELALFALRAGLATPP